MSGRAQVQSESQPRPAPAVRRFHRLEVAAVDRLTDDAVALAFAVPERLRPAYRFTAGQHVALRLPGEAGGAGAAGGAAGAIGDGTAGGEDSGAALDPSSPAAPAASADVRRTYSLCLPQEDAPARLRVAVRRVPGGAFSEFAVDRLAPGDRLDVLTPTGRFGLAPGARRHAAVVGGSGITPVASLVATALRDDPGATFLVLRAERTAASVMLLEELQELKDRYVGRLQLVHLLSREERQAGPPGGRPDAASLASLLPGLLAPAAVDAWYLCGPYGLIRAAEHALRSLGVPRGRVHQEVFHVDEAPDTRRGDAAPGPAVEGGCTVTALLDGRTTEFRTDGRAPLLDGLLAHRQDAPFACRGGVCGTCRARLLTGEVRMDRNFALEPEEVSGGYVLTCQARPVSGTVRVDYDA